MDTDNTPIYSVRNLSYPINGRLILDNVTFSVGRGEFLAVIGPNGAGKSTLLRHLVRIIRPPAGTVSLFGRCVNDFRQRDIALHVGYVPQTAPDFLPFTAIQFVMMGRYPRINPLVRPGVDEREKALDLLNKVGMHGFADRQIDKMSGGERQKIFIAAALAQQPDILLLDEPTTFLDPKHQCDIHDTLESLNVEHNIAVVAVSHDINFASRFSRRVLAMKKGAVVLDGPVSDILYNGRLESLFETPFDFVSQEKSGDVFAFPRRKK